MADHVRTEEYSVAGSDMKAKLKELLRQGKVRRIVIRNPEGRTIVDLPVAVGLLGAAFAPLWAAVGGLLALTARYTVVVERTDLPPGSVKPM